MGKNRNDTMQSGLKRYQHDALMPIYKEHAFYLLRVLKTAVKLDLIDIDEFRGQIPKWRREAKCHEVAINEFANLDLETHQNRLGKEKEYTEHPVARNIGRDLRVKIIWDLIAGVLDEDPQLKSVKPYPEKTLALGHEWTGVKCPFCHTIFYSDEWTKEIDGEHLDGTLDWHWENTGTDYNDKPCKHLMGGSDINFWLNDDFNEIVDEYSTFQFDEKDVVGALEERGLLDREEGTQDDHYWFSQHSLKEIEDAIKEIPELNENDAKTNRKPRIKKQKQSVRKKATS